MTGPYPWRGDGAWTRLRMKEQTVDEHGMKNKSETRTVSGVDRLQLTASGQDWTPFMGKMGKKYLENESDLSFCIEQHYVLQRFSRK